MAGDAESGVTTFRIEAGLDTGPILKQRRQVIAPRETAGSLLTTLADIGAQLLVATLDELAAGSAVAAPQPTSGITVAPRIQVAQARIDWGQSAVQIDRLIRGMTPAPGAWTSVTEGPGMNPARVSNTVKIAPVEVQAQDVALAPGEILLRGQQVWVGTGDRPVGLTDVQPAGKRWMSAAEWLRGWRGEPPTFCSAQHSA
jgi:methionyl-tRNA formyltransferase